MFFRTDTNSVIEDFSKSKESKKKKKRKKRNKKTLTELNFLAATNFHEAHLKTEKDLFSIFIVNMYIELYLQFCFIFFAHRCPSILILTNYHFVQLEFLLVFHKATLSIF